MTEHKIIQGDCIEQMRLMEDNSIDSIVTDPPYELGFMGKSWDSTGIAFNVEVWAECLRVLKPGGHLLAFSGSRTYHRMAVAIEDAGFEIRDQIMWIYGSGFPKSLNLKGDWQGWGTALKPAHEPIVVARKPLIGTVAANVLTYGTGGLNIDGARVGSDAMLKTSSNGIVKSENRAVSGPNYQREVIGEATGRWPANVIHDGSEQVLELFPTNAGGGHWTKTKTTGFGEFGGGSSEYFGPGEKDGKGSAARFFYCAKTSKRDRNEGLEDFEAIRIHDGREEGGVGGSNPRNRSNNYRQNHHPTVKPTDLMRYLCRLVTPKGGIVLDPFTGSGSTGKAAIYEGFSFIGIEMTDEYLPIAKARIEFAINNREETLFDA